MVSGSFIQHCGKCPEEILSGQGRCLVSKVYINREEKPARGERACGFPEKGGDHVGEATSETDPRAHLERSQEWASLESMLGGPHQPGHFPASLPFPHCHQQDLPQEKKKKTTGLQSIFREVRTGSSWGADIYSQAGETGAQGTRWVEGMTKKR